MTRLIPTLEVKINNRSHIHLNADKTKLTMTNEERDSYMIHTIMKKYELKTDLRKFKEKCGEVVTKELTQLHVQENVSPVDATKLTKT